MSPRPRRDFIIIAVFAALVLTAIVIGVRNDWLSLKSLWSVMSRLHEARGTGLMYALLLVAVAAVGLPTTPLLLIGGVLFGVVKGILLSWVAMVIGAILGYFLARRIGKNSLRRVIERMAGHEVRFSGKRAIRTLMRLRLAPITPYGAVNFAAGLAGMPFRDYVIGTAIGSLPGIAVMTYFASRVLSGGMAPASAIAHTLVVASLLWALSYAPRLWDRLFNGRSERNGLNPRKL